MIPSIALFFLGALIVQWLLWPERGMAGHAVAAAAVTLCAEGLLVLAARMWRGR